MSTYAPPPADAGTVPPGPGVVPPFAAPPTEGRTRRMWYGLGAGAVALVLCCGLGGLALVGVAVTLPEALNEQARAVVSEYLGAVQRQDYGAAYNLLCDAEQAGNLLELPARLEYAGAAAEDVRFTLEQDRETATFEVCGVER